MILKVIDFIELNIYEIKVNKRTILLDGTKISSEIEYILFTSLDMEYKLNFYNIYENLVFSIPLNPNSVIMSTKNSIKIKQ